MKTSYSTQNKTRDNRLSIFEMILIVLLISCTIYLAIAMGLIISNKPSLPNNNQDSISFADAINADYETLEPLESADYKGDKTLNFRHYESESSTLLILIHGSGWHGMQFHPMASQIAGDGIANVVVPDLRGHGLETQQRGDVDYIGQLEDDISDLISYLKSTKSFDKIIIGGHSSGGGLAIRYAGNTSVEGVDGNILMAPFLKYNAPTTKENSGNWAFPASRRIAGLTMLNNVGITALNHLPVIAFNMSKEVLDGPLGSSVSGEYSFRLNTSYALRMNYTKDISGQDVPFLLIAGKDDESFLVNEYQPLMKEHTRHGEYVLMDGIDHIGITTDNNAIMEISSWQKK